MGRLRTKTNSKLVCVGWWWGGGLLACDIFMADVTHPTNSTLGQSGGGEVGFDT